jgi:PncC family amidohydrolase
LLEKKGAVCPDVAAAMAQGALSRSPADVAIAITGVAGPDPDEDGNPVGLVCIALAKPHGTRTFEFRYGNLGRESVQARAIEDALTQLITLLKKA